MGAVAKLDVSDTRIDTPARVRGNLARITSPPNLSNKSARPRGRRSRSMRPAVRPLSACYTP